MENLTRNAALAALLTLVSSACTSTSPDHDGQEAESESEGDQPCPPEGCETEMPCRDDDNCPDDDPCRDYFCNGRNGFCRYLETDEDGDGYVRKSCDGSDCDDRSDEDCPVDVAESEFCGKQVHPRATEECNGIDDDCDGRVDEELADQPCGPDTEEGICAIGARSCRNGRWSDCVGAVYPEKWENETCDGLDNDCDGQTDNVVIPCKSAVGCLGFRRCVGTSRGACDAPDPTPTETKCAVIFDTDCDGLRGCDDDDCLDRACTSFEEEKPHSGICRSEGATRYCDWWSD